MQQVGALNFAIVERSQSLRRSPGEQVFAAWQRLRSLYRWTDGPQIFASYYAGAFDRVSAAEPVASFKDFTP